MLVPTFDNIPCFSKNWKQLEHSTSRDWLNKSWHVYVVNLISSDYPRVVVVEEGGFIFSWHTLYFLYIWCYLNIFQATSVIKKIIITFYS